MLQYHAICMLQVIWVLFVILLKVCLVDRKIHVGWIFIGFLALSCLTKLLLYFFF